MLGLEPRSGRVLASRDGLELRLKRLTPFVVSVIGLRMARGGPWGLVLPACETKGHGRRVVGRFWAQALQR